MKIASVICMGLVWVCVTYASLEGDMIETGNKYGFGLWGGSVKENYSRKLTNWEIPVLSLATNGISTIVKARSDGNERYLLLFAAANGDCLLWINSECCENVMAAQESIVGKFNSMTTVANYSTSTNNFGDRSYTFNHTAIFARNNIFVHVNSRTNSISAEAVARQIDTDILQKSCRD